MQAECDAMKKLLDEKHRQQDMNRWSNVVKRSNGVWSPRKCQFMAGDDHVICAEPTYQNYSYCEPHFKLCTQPLVLEPKRAYR